MSDLVQVPAQQFTFALVAEQFQAGRIKESAVTFEIEAVNPFCGRVQQQPGLEAAFGQGFFGFSALDQDEQQIGYEEQHQDQKQPEDAGIELSEKLCHASAIRETRYISGKDDRPIYPFCYEKERDGPRLSSRH